MPSERQLKLLAQYGFPAVVLLISLGYCATQSTSLNDAMGLAKRMGTNAAESQIPDVERLGFAGAVGINIASNVETAYQVFTRELTESGRLALTAPEVMAADPTYLRLAAAQPTGDDLRRAAEQSLSGGPDRAERQGNLSARSAAIVFFGSANGFNAPGVFAPFIIREDSRLARFNEAEAAALAASLGVDYLITVGFIPMITAYEPGNMAGYIMLTHRVRVFDSSGKLVLSDHTSLDIFNAATGGYPTIDGGLTTEQRKAMGASRLTMLFPTEAQRVEIAEVERTLMAAAYREKAQLAAREVVALFQ